MASQGQYVLRFTADTGQAEARLRSVAQAGEQSGRALSEGMGGGARDGAAAITIIDREAQKLEKTVREMAATWGMSKVETLAYKAEQLGLSDALAAPLEKLRAHEAAQRGIAESTNIAAGAASALAANEEQLGLRLSDVAIRAGQYQRAMAESARASYAAAATAGPSGGPSVADVREVVARQSQAMIDAARQTAAATREQQAFNEALQLGATSFGELESQFGMLDSVMAKGAMSQEQYAASFATLSKEEARLTQSLDSLRSRYDPVGAATRKLAQDEAKLADAFKHGQLTQQEYNAALAGLDADKARVGLAGLAQAQRELEKQFKAGEVTSRQYKQSLAEIEQARAPLEAVAGSAKVAGSHMEGFSLKTAGAKRELL
ncbi:hypothetical protein SAMN05216551_1224, partial [Chitinasiproducens palmae]